MIRFSEGECILHNGRLCIIKRIVSFDAVEVQDVETGVRKTVARAEVHPPLPLEVEERRKVIPEVLTDEQKRVIDMRYEVIAPTIGRMCTKALIAERAAKAVEFGLLTKGDPSTIYEWIRKFRQTGDRNSLAPPTCPDGGRGSHRLRAEVEELLATVIDGSFLTAQKKKPTAVWRDVEIAFNKENIKRMRDNEAALPVPCKKTVLARIKQTDPMIAEKKRYGSKSSKERFGIMKDHLQCGRWPWDLGQMDHKQLRTVVVDEVTAEPLGNPWLTVIIDTNSRVPPGFVLSLKKPSATNIGLCLSMSMIPKEFWLNKWGMDHDDFPVWGKWGTIQVDNELKNEAAGIIEGCRARGIELEFRPLKNPQSGGFIETLFRTIDIETKNFPGFKSKNKRDRENYNANVQAVFTFKGLYEAVAYFIIKIYCQRTHSGLGRSPLSAYKENLFSSGIGIPDMVLGDEARELVLDFMPCHERTIQEYGVELFNTCYRSEDLAEYIKLGKEVR